MNEDNAREGLVGLVVALVEVIHDVLKLQAVRRMENHSLTAEQLERVGRALLSVERCLDQLKRDMGLTDAVTAVRSDLDALVAGLIEPEFETGGRT